MDLPAIIDNKEIHKYAVTENLPLLSGARDLTAMIGDQRYSYIMLSPKLTLSI